MMASNKCMYMFSKLKYVGENGFRSVPTCLVPTRSTYILKRRYPPALVKKGEEEHYRKFKAKNYIYDVVENTETKKQRSIQLVLTSYVEGVGQKGDLVEVKKNFGYHKLLLPGLADYPTEQDIRNAEQRSHMADEKQFSSRSAPLIQKFLEKMVLGIVMNKETPWTLEPWHVKVAFRKAGVNVPLDAIKLPQLPINGPDISLENKEFIVLVTINKREVARVRSRVHHWSTSIQDRLPYVVHPWCQPAEPLFQEDVPILDQLPLPPMPKNSSKFVETN